MVVRQGLAAKRGRRRYRATNGFANAPVEPGGNLWLNGFGSDAGLEGRRPSLGAEMILLLTFTAIFLVGQATNIGIALVVEKFSDSASLAVFFALFAVVVVAGWQVAVWLTDRLFGPASHEHST